MERHSVTSPEVEALCGKIVNRYSHGVAVKGGRTVYIAGQYAPGEGGPADQYRSVLKKIEAVVRAAGGTLEHLVKLTNFVSQEVDLERDWPAMLEVRRDLFTSGQYPAQALIIVAGLMDGALVEVEGIAVVPD